jgi:MoaA/NifB/PqqE/SkfB family radical SAM enzyme
MLNVTESTKHKCPIILEFHPGVSCRLNCGFCYRNTNTYNSSYELISNDCLKKLIYEFAVLGGQELYISGGLEPFSVYLTVCHALLLAHNAGLKTRVYTNGTEPALQKGWVQELLVCTTAQIRFSVHARSVNTYSEITGIRNAKTTFALVKENILSLLERKDGYKPLIGIGFLVLPENINELIEAAEFWRDMGADFFDLRFDSVTELSACPEISQEVSHFRCLADLNHFSPMQVNIGDFAHGKPRFASQCYAPFQKLVVDPFGLVWGCCLQAQPGYRPTWAKLGDLKSDFISVIIEGIRNRFPRSHCLQCTPYEAQFNLNNEKPSQLKTVSAGCPRTVL